jgi:hypothetical protein
MRTLVGGASSTGKTETEQTAGIQLVIFGTILTPTNPPGTVLTMPEERYSLKMWNCQMFGSSSAACRKDEDPEYTYMEAELLADFRNAMLSQAQLGRDFFNPVAAATTTLKKRRAEEDRKRFFSWWRRCHKPTWAMWLTTHTFNDSIVPRDAFNWFVSHHGSKLLGGGTFGKSTRTPPCPSSSTLNSLFKIKDQWKASEMAVAPPAQAGRDPDTPVEYQPPTDPAEIAQMTCKPGATLSVIAEKRYEEQMRAEGCGVVKTIVSGAPDKNIYCCPPDFLRPWETPPGVDQRGQPQPETAPVDDAEGHVTVTTPTPELDVDLSPLVTNGNGNGAPLYTNGDLLDEEPGFFSRYKWFIAIGALAAMGGAAWWWVRRSRAEEEVAELAENMMLPPPKSRRHPSGL